MTPNTLGSELLRNLLKALYRWDLDPTPDNTELLKRSYKEYDTLMQTRSKGSLKARLKRNHRHLRLVT